jgi:uncharacterized protein
VIVNLVLLACGGAAGAALGRLIRMPLWPLTGAILGAGAVHLFSGLEVLVPQWWTFTAQILVGTAVGSRVKLDELRKIRGLILPASIAVVSIVVAGVAVGLGIGQLGIVESVVAALGTIPGGGGEMVAAATSLHADSSVVAGMHVLRVLVVLTVLPVAVAWLVRRGRGGDKGEPSD